MTAAITGGYVTLLDLAKVMANMKDGMAEPIGLLAESNPILQDANVMPCNTPNGHISVWQSTLPSGTWRNYNQGVALSKGTTKQVVDIWGSLEALCDVDVALAERSGNSKKFRAIQDNLHITGLNKDAADSIFYANWKLDPEKFHGLSPRYNSLTTGDFYPYVVNGGGSGDDNTSIWMITWGPMTCSLIYPPGTKAGLEIVDRGQQRVPDSSGSAYFYVWESQFVWKLGLAVIDPRYVTRICNVDVSDLTVDAASGADLLEKLKDAYLKRPTGSLGESVARTFIYCNKTIWGYLWSQSSNKSNVQLTQGSAGGVPFVAWNGIPIHICDSLDVDEAAVA